MFGWFFFLLFCYFLTAGASNRLLGTDGVGCLVCGWFGGCSCYTDLYLIRYPLAAAADAVWRYLHQGKRRGLWGLPMRSKRERPRVLVGYSDRHTAGTYKCYMLREVYEI